MNFSAPLQRLLRGVDRRKRAGLRRVGRGLLKTGSKFNAGGAAQSLLSCGFKAV